MIISPMGRPGKGSGIDLPCRCRYLHNLDFEAVRQALVGWLEVHQHDYQCYLQLFSVKHKQPSPEGKAEGERISADTSAGADEAFPENFNLL